MTVQATVCHIFDRKRLLLQRKAAGLFGEGKWNGVGGKLKAGESPIEGARREVREETGLQVSMLKQYGVLRFYFGHQSNPDWIVHVFSTHTFEGVLKASEEGFLHWFPFDAIPYEDMWQDDAYWLPLLLKGHRFNGNFYFNENGTKLVDSDLEIEE